LALVAKRINGEVILPGFTFVASANSIVTAGAVPVFAEVRPDTFNIDPDSIKKKITKKTQAIMVVHFAGQCCQMDEIVKIADKYGLLLIEDSAETIGGKFRSKMAGSFGVGCFSFFPTKNITTGEGGMVTTNDKRLAQDIKTYASHGIQGSTLSRTLRARPWIRDAQFAGYNFRLSNILAAIGVEQLKRLNALNSLRRRHAEFLNSRLSQIQEIRVPEQAKNRFHVYQMYVITVDEKKINRDKFILNLRKNGVGASVHFTPPAHLHTYYRKKFGFRKGDLPITEKLANSVVTLPMYPQMKERELKVMVKIIENSIKHARR
ncbi:DegT/DnrJ/EryC1/StrS family aminotransferase, partial [Candidatus Omnitrophota bacterium]